MSQRGLGLAMGLDAGVASPRINQYERGKREPDLSTLKLLAKTLDVPTAYFYCDDQRLAELLLGLQDLPIRRRRKLLLSFIAAVDAAAET